MFSQPITGIVKDSVTGKNIAFANIVLKNGKGTYSSETGLFELEIKDFKTDSLKVSILGYQSKILPASDFKNKSYYQILLAPKIEILNEVLISSRKINYTDKEILGEKKEGNISVTSLIGYETAIYIENPRRKKALLNKIYIDLKKRKDAQYIATLNIKFYEVDTISKKPTRELHNENYYVKPKNKKYRLWINVKDLRIPFPKNGIYIGVEMVNTHGKVEKYSYFGPMFRYTLNNNEESKTWSNYHNSGWKKGSVDYRNLKKMKHGILNPVMGIEVMYPTQ